MLRLRVDVNGEEIAVVAIHNRGSLGGDVWTYDACLIDHGRPDESIAGVEGIYHHRGQGWGKLTRIVLAVMDDIRNEKRKEKR